ncbi:MAG: hypothetical protein ACTSVU_09180 [Promethearchaeota archaeon]
MSINRFTSGNLDRIQMYEEMIRKISKDTNIKRNRIHQLSEEALQNWQSDIFQEPYHQSQFLEKYHVDALIKQYREILAPIMTETTQLNKNLELIRETFTIFLENPNSK